MNFMRFIISCVPFLTSATFFFMSLIFARAIVALDAVSTAIVSVLYMLKIFAITYKYILFIVCGIIFITILLFFGAH